MQLCVEVTQKCNLKCDFCLTREGSNESLSLDRIIEAIEERNITKLLFSGGEPLLRNDLFVMVTELRKRYDQLFISISTHGLFKSKMLRLADYINQIDISVPTLNQNTYVNMRGGGSVEKLKKNILSLQGQRIHVRVNHMITSINLVDWKDVLAWCNYKIDSVRITQYWPLREAYYQRRKFEISEEVLEKQIEEIKMKDYSFYILYPFEDINELTEDYLVMDSNGRLFYPGYGKKHYLNNDADNLHLMKNSLELKTLPG